MDMETEQWFEIIERGKRYLRLRIVYRNLYEKVNDDVDVTIPIWADDMKALGKTFAFAAEYIDEQLNEE